MDNLLHQVLVELVELMVLAVTTVLAVLAEVQTLVLEVLVDEVVLVEKAEPGEPVELEPGPLRLDMQVVAGEGGVPVFCDERELVVAGDVTVDFSGVQSCDL